MEEVMNSVVNEVPFNEEDKEFLQATMVQLEWDKAKRKELEEKIAVLNSVVDDFKKQLQRIQDGIDLLEADTLSLLTKHGKTSASLHDVIGEEAPDLVAEVFTRVTNVFEDEKVLTLLKELGNHPECINIKESIKKRELNKAIKSDQSLADQLEHDGLIGTTTTTYVVVAPSETIAQMHEHIENKE